MGSIGDTGVLHTTIQYEVPPDKGGETYQLPGCAQTFQMKYDCVEHDVNDVRGHDDDYSLDKNGFAWRDHVANEKLFEDDAKIKAEHYKEVQELLRAQTGASRVLPFSHIIRRQTWEAAVEKIKDAPENTSVGFTTPGRFVHVDQSYDGAIQILESALPDEMDTLMKKRWGIINVWRPISTVTRDPFGAIDWQSIDEEQLFPKTIRLPPKGSGTFENVSAGTGRGFERWAIKASPNHRWYYKSEQRPDEVFFVKCFDSRKDVARCAPHGAFVDPRTTDQKPRESIEVRCLVFWVEDN